MSKLIESYSGFLGSRPTTRRGQILEYTQAPPRRRLPPMPGEATRYYAQLPPESRRDVEDEAEDLWRWYHTGLVALTTLASVGAVYWAVKNDLFKLGKAAEGAKKEAQDIEDEKDDKIDKTRHRNLMGKLRAMNVFYDHAEREIEGLTAEARKKPSAKLAVIGSKIEAINKKVRNYIITNDINSLESAIDLLDMLEQEVPEKAKEFEVLSKSLKTTVINQKRAIKAHNKAIEKIQGQGETIALPTGPTGAGSEVNIGQLIDRIGIRQTLSQEALALLPDPDKIQLEKEFYPHMRDAHKLISQLHNIGSENSAKSLYTTGSTVGKQLAVWVRDDNSLNSKIKKRAADAKKYESNLHESIWGRRTARRIPGQMAEFL